MDKLKNLLIAIAGLVVMVGAIIAVTPATSQGQGGTSGKDVNVVNTPTVLAQQSGPWTVGISGTPTVRVVGAMWMSPQGSRSSGRAKSLSPPGRS